MCTPSHQSPAHSWELPRLKWALWRAAALGLFGLSVQVLDCSLGTSSKLASQAGLDPRYFICFSRALDLNAGPAFPSWEVLRKDGPRTKRTWLCH